MIVKNEEQSLSSCLHSIKPYVQEIVIVDTGSTDKTKEIATSFGAKVVDFTWNDHFANARNAGLEQATGDWILVLDADERLSNPDQIKKLVDSASANVGGFMATQCSYLKKKVIGATLNAASNQQEFPFVVNKRIVRLFRRDNKIRYAHRVHELVEDSVKAAGLVKEPSSLGIEHYGHEEVNKEKQDYYTSLIFRQLEDDDTSPRYHYQVGRVYLGQGKLDRALGEFERVAELDSQFRLIYNDIAKIHVMRKDLDQAIACYTKSLEVKPGVVSTAHNLIVTLVITGRAQEAKGLLKKFLEEFPSHPALKMLEKKVL